MAFGYPAATASATDRLVEPHRLVQAGYRWYLVARDVDRDDWRTFRVDRIDAPRLTGVRFVPRDPPDAASFVATAVTTAPYRYQARVLLHAPRSGRGGADLAELRGAGAGRSGHLRAHDRL